MAKTLTITHWRVNETKPAFSEAQVGSLEIGTSDGGMIFASVEDARQHVARILDSEEFLFALAMAYGFAADPTGKDGSGAPNKDITVDLAAAEPVRVVTKVG